MASAALDVLLATSYASGQRVHLRRVVIVEEIDLPVEALESVRRQLDGRVPGP